MATNTLLQKLFAVDETGVGETDAGVSNRQQIETFRCSEAIAAGATVSLDVSQTSNGLRGMVVSEADAADYIPVGIAVSAGAEDSFIEVTIRGIVEEALTKGDVVGITAGDALVISSAGKLEKAPSYRTDLGDGTGVTAGTYLFSRLSLLLQWKRKLLMVLHECSY
jgi:precorrin-2 methylase